MVDQTLRVTKLSPSKYRVVLRDNFRRLDEELDRSQLLAILKAETLLDLKAREVSVVDVLFRLDYEAEGYEIVIGVGLRPLRRWRYARFSSERP